ncbi:hypothetical protein PR048_012198 [Dryococelus australis]|uniref:Uncharacterized protein n=1 Tax=Dryococelus australis TaxID=614101 RepID=A0ABQ9HNR5_9NEOP|nr:hypothetical protein PR048_012198 [Dryococelus australis]
MYKIPRRTILNKLKNYHFKEPGLPPASTVEEENSFSECIQHMSDFGFPLDEFYLRVIVRSYLNLIGRQVKIFKRNLPGHEWLLGFMKRHPELSVRFAANIKRTRAAINEQTLRDFVRNLGEIVKDVPQRIFGTLMNQI